MAVQAGHLSPSLLTDGVYRYHEFSMSMKAVLDINSMHNMYHPLPLWSPLKSESGITYADNWCLTLPSRKRRRDYVGYADATMSYGFGINPKYDILGEELPSQIQRDQLDVDGIISQHMEKVKMYIDEKIKIKTRQWMSTVEQQVARRIRASEEEIDRIGKLNWALDERIKSLSMENQIWKDLACANEATANSLRRNLEVALSVAGDDAESWCGSSVQERMKCKGCGKGEVRVVALPCRHLSMCTSCGSSKHVCPVCRSPKNASVVVNFS